MEKAWNMLRRSTGKSQGLSLRNQLVISVMGPKVGHAITVQSKANGHIFLKMSCKFYMIFGD